MTATEGSMKMDESDSDSIGGRAIERASRIVAALVGQTHTDHDDILDREVASVIGEIGRDENELLALIAAQAAFSWAAIWRLAFAEQLIEAHPGFDRNAVEPEFDQAGREKVAALIPAVSEALQQIRRGEL